MNVREYSISEIDKWDEYVASSPSFSLLQSWTWGTFKEKLGWKVHRVAIEEENKIIGAAQMLVRSLPADLPTIAYIPRGPLVDWKDESIVQPLFSELHNIARVYRAMTLILEPPLWRDDGYETIFRNLSFIPGRRTNQPRNTILIDIQAESAELLSQMRKKTRQYIRKSMAEGITVRHGGIQDLPAFIALMNQTARREQFTPRSNRYYQEEFKAFSERGECALLIAERDGKLLASRMVFAFGNHAAEFHAGSVQNLEGLHPNYLLVWEGIQWAKAKGCMTYDMWGVPDDITGNIEQDESTYLSRTDGLWGVYRFKSGFSNNLVTYIGRYDYVYSPFLYKVVSIPFASSGAMEKLSTWIDLLKIH